MGKQNEMRSDGGRAEKSDEGFGTGATGRSSTETNACLLRSLSCSMENGLSGGQRASRILMFGRQLIGSPAPDVSGPRARGHVDAKYQMLIYAKMMH